MLVPATQIPTLHVGQGLPVGPLTVFPVWTDAPAPDRLSYAVDADVAVAEHDGSPVVGELVLTNRSDLPVLLLEGELLEGGWQHRALQHDVILAPASTMVASVNCVEAGRWNGSGTHTRRGRRASGTVRAALNTAPIHARQQEVWSRVSDYDRAFAASPTSSFVDHLDGQAIDDDASCPVLDGQRGVVIAVSGQPVVLELFPSHDALAASLPALIGAFMLDARASGLPVERTPSRRARRFVHRLELLDLQRRSDVDAGIGVPVMGDSDYAALRGVTLDDEWAHFSAFNRRHALVGAE